MLLRGVNSRGMRGLGEEREYGRREKEYGRRGEGMEGVELG